ncbi:MAG: LytTR family DNA-binding domain-containing protein [Raineya sp.]|jgi:two-component system LytT family response regulator|nr:LytTR family DNA-binding domain-containing protein [Raineya sp.]
MENKKVIIIDDEEAARTILREYIISYTSYQIVDEATNGQEAVEMINKNNPDLIFLDVQMPILNGFEVLTHLNQIPPIIFSTAYDQYALKAFEVHALDYLLKPYTKSRFMKALERVFEISHLKSLVEQVHQKKQYLEKIFVSYRNRLITIDAIDIIYIEAQGDYANLITTKGNFLSNEGLGGLETKLDPQLFVRIHRSAIVNLNYVDKIENENSHYIICLTNGVHLKVSRANKYKIKDRII